MRYQIKAGGAMNSPSPASPMRAVRTLLWGVAIVAALGLGAALALHSLGTSQPGPARPAGVDIRGARVGGPFALTGTDGRTVRDGDFAGRYRIVYFGYTYCPDVCPTDMQKLGRVLRDLEKRDPARAAKIAPIFITIDPERDTPARLGEFVAAFHPRLVGLTGSPQAIDGVAKAYAAAYAKGETSPGGGYLMMHDASMFLMGPRGEPIERITPDMGEAEIVAELEKWVQ